MGIFDTVLDSIPGVNSIKSFAETAAKSAGGSFLFNILTSRPDTKDKAEKIKENAENERSGIFSEAMGTAFNRWSPGMAAAFDVVGAAASVTPFYKRPEGHALQNEISFVSSIGVLLSLDFMPDFFVDKFVRRFTDKIYESDVFQFAVAHWLFIPEEMRKDLLMEKDENGKPIKKKYKPKNVFAFIRIMNSDIALGKVTLETVAGWVPSLTGGGMLDKMKPLFAFAG